MPGIFHHSAMTREALRALPPWAREALGPAKEALVEETCMFPDRYYGIESGAHERARPYALLIDGIQFHYLPNTPIEGEYKYWRVVDAPNGRRLERVVTEPNENWRHARIGFTHYLEQSALALRDGRLEDVAGFLGTLLHTLQDASTFLHSLEGPDGTDLFVLNRLLDPPGGDISKLPSFMLDAGKNEWRMEGYRPRLLGMSVPEAAFRLYSVYAGTVMRSRRKLIPLVLKRHAGDEVAAEALCTEILADAARICADTAHTAACLAFNRFDKDEIAALDRVHLSDLKPVREPRGLSLPYRFITYLCDAALDVSLQKRSLVLVLDGKRREFAKGLGTGCHYEYVFAWELPADVYRLFTGAVGLHPYLSENGQFTAEVRLNGVTAARADIGDSMPAAPFELDVTGGGMLELRVESRTGMGGAVRRVNNIVWADLIVSK